MTWQPPKELPDLRRVDGPAAIDIESNDEGIRGGLGPGWPWRGGYVCGIALAWRQDGVLHAIYIPLRHPGGGNFDPAAVYRWLADLIAAGVRFITQNGLYDWGWLWADGGIAMPPPANIEEIGAIATLLDETRSSYSLDVLCAWCGLPGKDETLLEQAIAAAGPASGRKKHRPQEFIWQLPAHVVGPYAERDAAATLEVFEKLNPKLDLEGARAAYRLECDLQPLTLAMRRRGIRIDSSRAEQACEEIERKRDAALAALSAELGTPVGLDEINGRNWKIATFDKHGIKYPFNENDKPSFTKDWMEAHPHWLPRGITVVRKYERASNIFLKQHILGHIINGRIHADIRQFKMEDGGAKSLRFSYSDPPLQQMPSRDPELGPLTRDVFLPEENGWWASDDASQQEFRILVHQGVVHGLSSAQEAAETYRSNPDADFHTMAAELTGLDRTPAKAVNFGKIYGMGLETFAQKIGKPLAETRAIMQQYDRKLPFVARLSRIIQNRAGRDGYTVLYGGARRHWNLWVPEWSRDKPCEYEEARRRRQTRGHPWYREHLVRSHVYTALNALIQGSAATHTKLWMRACWREGIVPLLQMHDALELSVATREQAELVARLGSECIQLEVPMKIDVKFGRRWGSAKNTWEERDAARATAPAKPINGANTTVKPSNDTKRTPPPSNGANATVEALQLWEAGAPIAGTPVARYLAEGMVDLAALPEDIDDVLRCGPGGCLLALMHDARSGAPTGVLRIVAGARETIGRAGVVKVWRAASQLVVGERLETVLAVATRLPYRGALLQPAWAIPSLRQFPVIAGVERLVLLAERDTQAAAETCKRRWQQAGRAGARLTPDTDFMDAVRDHSA